MPRRESILGQIVADRFKVLSVLGEGGTGQVYLAEHDVLERQFAIKVLRRDLISDQTAAERFRREARAASRLQHRNIVYISDFGSLKDGRLYLVMEYIPGDELSLVIAREKRLPRERAARILIQVAEALDYAHDMGVVHRDLKSENIILTTERHRQDVVKILDFGLAKILFGAGNLETITFKGQIFGTPEYIPPEQIVGDDVDQRADIYAMAVLAFEMVTGRTPFTGTLMELLVAHRKLTPPLPSVTCPDANIPPCFDEIVSRGMQKRPADRFGRASEIASLLREYLLSLSQTQHLRIDSDLEIPDPGDNVGREPGALPADPPGKPPTPSAAPEPQNAAVPYASTVVEHAIDLPPEDGGQSMPRQRLRDQARRIANLLQRSGLANPGLRAALEASYRLEDEVLEAEAELGLLQTRLEEMELSGREQESQLRYAIIDLGMARSQLEQSRRPPPGHEAMLADLQFQITELERRLAEVSRSRETKLDELDNRSAGKQRRLDDLRASLVRHDHTLVSLVEAHRPLADQNPALRDAFAELHGLGLPSTEK